MKRDLCTLKETSKETYIHETRPMNMKRDVHTKETFIHEKRPEKRSEKRRIYMETSLHA